MIHLLDVFIIMVASFAGVNAVRNMRRQWISYKTMKRILEG